MPVPALPKVEFAFPGPLRDSLVAAILSGKKRSTSALLRGYELDDEPLPQVGRRAVVVDSSGTGVGVIETTGVEVVALRDVSLQHALDEGENYVDVEDWCIGHLRFWNSAEVRAEVGDDFVIDDDTLVVLEQFVLIDVRWAQPTA
jgi:uncharacterized protein YhfF